MRIIRIVAEKKGLSINNLWIILAKRGLKITRQGFHKMAKSQGDYIKLDVLLLLMDFAELSWAEFGEMLQGSTEKK